MMSLISILECVCQEVTLYFLFPLLVLYTATQDNVVLNLNGE